MRTTASVLDHHLDAFGSQDLDAVLADYDDDSVIVTPDGTFRGLDEIEELFAGLFAEFSTEGASITMRERTVEGDFAYIIWEGDTPENDYEFATDTFHVPDDTITFQTFAGKIEPKDG
jgi:ketosteroid isomerase-like protein